MGWSNCLRTLAYSMARLIIACAAPRASAAYTVSTSSATARMASVDAEARRRAGASSSTTSNSFASDPRAPAASPPPVRSRPRTTLQPSPSARTSSTSAAAASGSAVRSPRRTTPLPESSGVGRVPSSGPRVAMVEPSAIPASSSAASPRPSGSGRVSPRRNSTARALDQCRAELLGNGPASTILMPAPPNASTSTPVAPRAASPRHTSSVVPLGSSSSGRTCAATLALSPRKPRTVCEAPAARRSVRGSSRAATRELAPP